MKSDQHPLIAINKKTLDIHNKQTGRHLTAIPSPQGGSGGRTHVQARHHGHEPLRPERLQTRQPPRPTLRNAPRASSTSAVSLPESRLDKTNDTSLTCDAKIMAASMTTNPATKEAMTNHDQSPAAADNSGLAFSINSRARTIAIGVGITATSSIILDAVHSDALVYRETLTNKTFTGFAFEGMGVDPATIAGPGAILRRVSVNATLNASVAYTYADDLAFYLDIPPLSTAGRLQIGGFSNLSATTRLSWPNGGSNAPGATVSGSFPENSWNSAGTTPIDLYTYFSAGNGIWIGNGYGAAGTSGTWTGYLEIEYDPVNAPSTEVPAPLPLAGAAASFAWARTLRRRIQEGSKR